MTYETMYNEADGHFESYDVTKDTNKLKNEVPINFPLNSP